MSGNLRHPILLVADGILGPVLWCWAPLICSALLQKIPDDKSMVGDGIEGHRGLAVYKFANPITVVATDRTAASSSETYVKYTEQVPVKVGQTPESFKSLHTRGRETATGGDEDLPGAVNIVMYDTAHSDAAYRNLGHLESHAKFVPDQERRGRQRSFENS